LLADSDSVSSGLLNGTAAAGSGEAGSDTGANSSSQQPYMTPGLPFFGGAGGVSVQQVGTPCSVYAFAVRHACCLCAL
jgi:hypothetical protein